MTKKQRREERNRLKRSCKAILAREFGVLWSNLETYPSICAQIRKYRPGLKLDGYELMRAFLGERPAKIGNTPKPETDAFLSSFEWRRLRMIALKNYGARCQCCGATTENGLMMHVDHIKPRKVYPELALDLSNLQVLCEVCNHGKGNWDMTDWRKHAPSKAES